jgi:hypothetical protein
MEDYFTTGIVGGCSGFDLFLYKKTFIYNNISLLLEDEKSDGGLGGSWLGQFFLV